LSLAKPLYLHTFAKPASGFGEGSAAYGKWGYVRGKYVMELNPGSYCFQRRGDQFGDFACEVIGRVAGHPAGQWGVYVREAGARGRGTGYGWRSRGRAGGRWGRTRDRRSPTARRTPAPSRTGPSSGRTRPTSWWWWYGGGAWKCTSTARPCASRWSWTGASRPPTWACTGRRAPGRRG